MLKSIFLFDAKLIFSLRVAKQTVDFSSGLRLKNLIMSDRKAISRPFCYMKIAKSEKACREAVVRGQCGRTILPYSTWSILQYTTATHYIIYSPRQSKRKRRKEMTKSVGQHYQYKCSQHYQYRCSIRFSVYVNS